MELPIPTAQHKWLNVPDQEHRSYGLWDVYATAHLEPEVQTLLDRSGNRSYWDAWWRDFVPVTLRMMQRGFGHVDRKALRQVRRRITHELAEVESNMLQHTDLFDRLHHEADAWAAMHWLAKPYRAYKQRHKGWVSRHTKADDRRERFFNYSNDLKALVFDEMGLRDAPARKGRERRSLNQDALVWMLDHLGKRNEQYRLFLHELFHRSRLNKLRGYLDFWAGPNDRVYPTIDCGSARTMRLAVSDPPLQQWPSEVRQVIRAAPDKVFVAADFSQLEPRILAAESGDELLLQCIRTGGDIHDLNTCSLFGWTEEQWRDRKGTPGGKAERNFTKSFTLGKSYGGRAETMNSPTFCPCHRCADKVPHVANLSTKERVVAEARWAQRHQGVVRYQERLVDEVRRRGRRYRSRFGYWRHFGDPSRQVDNQIKNFPMQHGAAEIVRRAMETIDRDTPWPLVFQIHDELVLEVDERDADQAKADLVGIMETPVPEYDNMVFPAEGKVAEHWGGLK